ncbi:MAG: hypothetical protein IKT56_02790 [Clostridia bacterium]|nr:hypothetical protein [Clostridia bacterium]
MDDKNTSADFTIPDFNLGIKKAAKGIAANSSLIVAFLAIVVAAMVFFTDLDGGFAITAAFSPSLVVLFFCCVVEYYSTKHMGTREGMREERYKNAIAEHKSVSRECQAKVGMRGLMKFCTDYAEQDLIRRRNALLAQVGISYDEYAENYMMDELPTDTPKAVRSVINRANKLKPIVISQDNLIFAVEDEKQIKLRLSTARAERIKDLSFLVPTLISTFFAASMVIEVIQDLSFATVTACMMKVFCIILNGVKGYQNGYYNIVDGHVECAETRTYLLEECIAWHSNDFNKQENKNGTAEGQNNECTSEE